MAGLAPNMSYAANEQTEEKLKKFPLNIKGLDDKYLIDTTTKEIFLQVLKSGRIMKGKKIGVFNTQTKKPRFLKWYTQKIKEARQSRQSRQE